MLVVALTLPRAAPAVAASYSRVDSFTVGAMPFAAPSRGLATSLQKALTTENLVSQSLPPFIVSTLNRDFANLNLKSERDRAILAPVAYFLPRDFEDSLQAAVAADQNNVNSSELVKQVAEDLMTALDDVEHTNSLKQLLKDQVRQSLTALEEGALSPNEFRKVADYLSRFAFYGTEYAQIIMPVVDAAIAVAKWRKADTPEKLKSLVARAAYMARQLDDSGGESRIDGVQSQPVPALKGPSLKFPVGLPVKPKRLAKLLLAELTANTPENVYVLNKSEGLEIRATQSDELVAWVPTKDMIVPGEKIRIRFQAPEIPQFFRIDFLRFLFLRHGVIVEATADPEFFDVHPKAYTAPEAVRLSLH